MMTYLTTNKSRRNAFDWSNGFGNLEKQLDSLFAGFPSLFEFQDSVFTNPAAEATKLRWYEKEDAYLVRVDLPGVSKGDIELNLEDDYLNVSAKRTLEDKGESKAIESFDYRKGFRIPEEVEDDKISASFENGVLNLTLPKAEKAKPRQISIK